MTAGIYAIRSITTGRVYIGSSVDIERRWKLHRGHLDRDDHPCTGLRQDCQEHGPKSFAFEVLEETDADTSALVAAEQNWIDRYRPLAYNSEQPVWRAPLKEKASAILAAGDGCVRWKLAKLLGDRRMSIAELQRQTGLSYVTLHGLYSDKTTRVDFETLNKICRALEVQPGDILEYAADPETAE